MAFPAKTSADEIRRTALDAVERGGAAKLSMRELSAEVGVAPNALYRYFPDRDALLAAVADDGARLLLAALERAAGRRAGVSALRAVADAYLAFAAGRPALYALVMTPHQHPEGHDPAHDALWRFVVGRAAGAVGAARAPAAAVSLWAYLHGVAGLKHAGLLGAHKPKAATREGLAALLQGLTGAAP